MFEGMDVVMVLVLVLTLTLELVVVLVVVNDLGRVAVEWMQQERV